MGHKNFGRNDPRFWGESRATSGASCELDGEASCERRV